MNNSQLNKNFNSQIQDITEARKQAYSSAKLGKALVTKTVKLIDAGKTGKRIHSPRLEFGNADPQSATLALNAELREKGIDAKAEVVTEIVGNPNDYGHESALRLIEVKGEAIKRPDTRHVWTEHIQP